MWDGLGRCCWGGACVSERNMYGCACVLIAIFLISV